MQHETFDIGVAFSETFDVIRKHPWKMVGWGALLTVIPFVFSLPLVLFLINNLDALADNPEVLGENFAFNMYSNFISLVQFVVAIPVMAAMARLVLKKPTDSRLLSLRIGKDELWVFVCFIALYFASMLAMLLVGAVGLIAGLAIYVATESMVPAVVVGIVIGLVGLLPVIWASFRLSLLIPASVDQGTLAFADAWRASRGNFWLLFGTAIIGFLVLLAISIVLLVLVGIVAGVVFGVAYAAGAFEAGNDYTGLILPGLIAFLLLCVPFAWASGATYAIYIGPFASAWRQLRETVQAP